MPIYPLFNKHLETVTPPRLYHYTNQDGIIGILNTWEMWATKIQYLNDRSEFHLALNIASELLKTKLNITKYKGYDWFLNDLIENVDKISQANVYVTSFSEDRDSLSQWRAYGERSSGFALGFYTSNLIATAKKNYCILAKCEYNEQKQRALMGEIVDRFVNHISLIFPPNLVDPNHDPKIIQSVNSFVNRIYLTAPLFKDKHFAGEKEWRIVADTESFTEGKIGFRRGTSMIIPFFKMTLSKEKRRRRIYDIVVGPTPHEAYSKNSIEMCLSINNIKCPTIGNSKIPFRSW